eukprot:3357669-Amphidinium_carterae.1
MPRSTNTSGHSSNEEFFTDFDPLKAGRCTKLQFTRAIAQIGAQVTDDEAQMCARITIDASGNSTKQTQ